MDRNQDFQWGPVARGLYIAMLWFALFLGFTARQYLPVYFALLFFLGVLLKPLLIYTGLHGLFQSFMVARDDKKWEKINKKRRREVDQQERSKALKSQRVKDPRLPKNW